MDNYNINVNFTVFMYLQMNFVIRFDNLTKLYENVLHFCQWQMAAYIRRIMNDKISIKIQKI